MKKFYVFLDIDGVLWDWEWRKAEIEKQTIKKGGLIKDFKPESMEALNALLEKIGEKYDSQLVISSSWRINMDILSQALSDNGCEYNKPLLKTKISSDLETRTDEIKEFLASNEEKENYLILDDEDFSKDFPKNKFIHTNMDNSSLSLSQVYDWLLENIKEAEPSEMGE